MYVCTFILYLVYSTVVFCYTRACNICPYFTSVFFLCTAHARNNELTGKERVEEV